MKVTMAALDTAYHELAREEQVCRPRIDIQSDSRSRPDLSVGHDGSRFDVRAISGFE
jgi:hypothetical protein